MAEQYIPQNVLDALPKKFGTKEIPNTAFTMGYKPPTVTVIDPPPNAIPIMGKGPQMLGGARDMPTGEYYIPLDIPNYPKTDAGGYPVPPLVAKYDASGNLQTITAQTRYLADTANNIAIQPEYNLKGELVSTNAVNNAEGEGGGIGDFLSTALKDFGPMLALGVGANYLAPLLSGAGAAAAPAAAAGGAGALSPYAAQAAGAYGGSTAAAGAAAAGSLAGIQQASAAQNALNLGIPSGVGAVTPPPPAPPAAAGSGSPLSGVTPNVVPAIPGAAASIPAAGTDLLSSLGGVGTAIMDFAKANPSIAGSLLGAVTGAIGAANAPKEATTQSNIDPQLKAEYLANIERAKTAAAGLGVRQFAEPGAMYTGAEQQLYNLGMTPFGAADIERFYNPFQEQVVQGALGDIERTRQMQEQANMEQATRARAFGGSRQGVVSGMTNEAALRQAATTGAQLRSAGFNTAANLGLAARPLDIAGLQTSLGLGTARTALEQARLDALRNLGTERLAITSGSLGIGIPNIGGSTSQPLYSNVAGSALSGGLTGSYIGSLLDPERNKRTT